MYEYYDNDSRHVVWTSIEVLESVIHSEGWVELVCD